MEKEGILRLHPGKDPVGSRCPVSVPRVKALHGGLCPQLPAVHWHPVRIHLDVGRDFRTSTWTVRGRSVPATGSVVPSGGGEGRFMGHPWGWVPGP
eukprot:scaffold1132_cov347-Pavlova_lutheri.AAC.11